MYAAVTDGNNWKPKWAENGPVALPPVEGGSIFPLYSIVNVNDSMIAVSNGVRFVRTLTLRMNNNAMGVPLRLKKRPKVSVVSEESVDCGIIRVAQREGGDSDCVLVDIEIDGAHRPPDGARFKVELEYLKPWGTPPILYEFCADDLFHCGD